MISELQGTLHSSLQGIASLLMLKASGLVQFLAINSVQMGVDTLL
jgi:hypothetical protein